MSAPRKSEFRLSLCTTVLNYLCEEFMSILLVYVTIETENINFDEVLVQIFLSFGFASSALKRSQIQF